MERRDLYQDDLTEERYPSPARRDDAAATEVLDPDVSAGEARTPLPRAIQGDPDDDEDDDDDEDEDDDEDDEDEDDD